MTISREQDFLLERAAQNFRGDFNTTPIVYRDPVRTHLALAFIAANQVTHKFTGKVDYRFLNNRNGCVIGTQTQTDNTLIRQKVEAVVRDFTA